MAEANQINPQPPWQYGDRVRKKSGSQWQGRIVGWYSTQHTPCGYAVESEAHAGSVQIYPETALERQNDMVMIYDGANGVSGVTMLDALAKARIFNVNKEETGRFRIEESCDNYFFAVLTREQLLMLADELRALADS